MRNKSEHKDRLVYKIILVLLVLCIILSLIILYEKIGYVTNSANVVSNFCSALAPANECYTVQTSSYSETFGISNPYYGIFGFGVLAIFAGIIVLSHKENKWLKYAIIAGTIISGVAALRFLYLQAFTIKAYCIFCVIIDILAVALMMLGAYILIYDISKPAKKFK